MSRLFALCVLVASAGACGGGSASGDGGVKLGNKDAATSPAQTSGIAGATPVRSLTADDQEKICDFTASLYGGYGGQVICDDGTNMTTVITGPASRAECLAQAAAIPPTCIATVSQTETCTRAISTCDPSDDAAATDACAAMFTCIPTSLVGSGGAGGAAGTPGGGAPDALGAGGTRQTGGAGGVTSTGGSTFVAATGGTTAPGTAGGGGATTGATTGAGGVAGTTGTSAYQPLCSNLVTAQGITPIKGGTCTDADPQLCYKTCGPQSIGFKSETCRAGVYEEESGCGYPPGDYSCYKIPTTMDPSCGLPQVSTACSVAPCTVCNFAGVYLDSSGATKTGYCICPEPSSTGVSRWICAATTLWPCPAGQGC